MLIARKTAEPEVTSVAAAHFMVVQAAFDRAAGIAGLIERFYSVGGYSIRLRFAGPALVPHLTPALAHRLAGRPQAPDLTICLWDTASTGTAMPPPVWGVDAYGARGEIIGFNDDRNQTNFQFKDESLRVAAVNLIDYELNTALYWIPDTAEFPYHERTAPLRMILNWWMGRHGRQVIHAGAVGTAQGGVLLAGKGGSGKSTVALSCLQSKLLYASDDYLLLDSDARPFAHSLYSSAKLHGDHLYRFSPDLFSAVSNRESLAEQKAVLFLNDYWPDKLTAGFPIRAILLPCVNGLPETRLRRASGVASLTALAPSSIFQLPGDSSKAFRKLASLVHQVPSYVLEVGSDRPGIPVVILKLLSELR